MQTAEEALASVQAAAMQEQTARFETLAKKLAAKAAAAAKGEDYNPEQKLFSFEDELFSSEAASKTRVMVADVVSNVQDATRNLLEAGKVGQEDLETAEEVKGLEAVEESEQEQPGDLERNQVCLTNTTNNKMSPVWPYETFARDGYCSFM
jgi:hypothetical protein